jgi:hypothetical protein
MLPFGVVDVSTERRKHLGLAGRGFFPSQLVADHTLQRCTECHTIGFSRDEQRFFLMKRLVILSSPAAAPEDERLSELATLVGVPAQTLALEDGGSSAHELLDRAPSCSCGLAMHMETLLQVHRSLRPGTTFQKLLDHRFSETLVYGVPAAAETNKALEALTDGTIPEVTFQPIDTVRYSLPDRAREFCTQLAGQSLSISRKNSTPTFEVRSGSGPVETIMAANERPMFVGIRVGDIYIFLLAGRMPDMNKPADRDIGLGDDCIELLPPLIFLRHCFPDSCWHGVEATARLIIDDPLLTRTYGALNFDTLKNSMRRFGYGASVAFIPWNHWRTSRRSAGRLLSEDSNLTVCIHGCDHTNREFAATEANILVEKSALGMQRMEAQRRQLGVPFEDVMVFPQGRFSSSAIPALRSTNYLAAVNSTCFPTDFKPVDLKTADFLWPAVTRYDGFPIFQRRYPRSLFAFALDVYLGKPALLVEHHDYFRDGGKSIEEFVTELQRIEPRLSWPSLCTLLGRSNLQRHSNNNCTEVRFFTRRFQLVPREGDATCYRLSKFEPDSTKIKDVLVDGKSTHHGFENGYLMLEVEAELSHPRNIEIVDRASSLDPVRGFGVAHNVRVFLRRGLSEFRDNTLSRHKGLLRIAKRIAKAAKATGEA